jgi:hypothetical protein
VLSFEPLLGFFSIEKSTGWSNIITAQRLEQQHHHRGATK